MGGWKGGAPCCRTAKHVCMYIEYKLHSSRVYTRAKLTLHTLHDTMVYFQHEGRRWCNDVRLYIHSDVGRGVPLVQFPHPHGHGQCSFTPTHDRSPRTPFNNLETRWCPPSTLTIVSKVRCPPFAPNPLLRHSISMYGRVGHPPTLATMIH